LGFRSKTYCLAYWRRVSILRSNSAVLLLRIGPTINSSFPGTVISNIFWYSLLTGTLYPCLALQLDAAGGGNTILHKEYPDRCACYSNSAASFGISLNLTASR